MTRGILTLAAFAALAAAVFAGSGAARTPLLTGEVGPGFSIEVKLGNKDVKTLKAGVYRIKVEDKGAIHNFHLKGPGVNKATSVPGTSEQIWTVRLRQGRYTYQCDPHAARGMKGAFTVT